MQVSQCQATSELDLEIVSIDDGSMIVRGGGGGKEVARRVKAHCNPLPSPPEFCFFELTLKVDRVYL